MHTKNISEICLQSQYTVSSYKVHFIDDNFTCNSGLQKQFRFLAHLDFLSPRLNTSMKWRADWSRVGRKVNSNNTEIFTVVRPKDDNLFRVNGGSVELRDSELLNNSLYKVTWHIFASSSILQTFL